MKCISCCVAALLALWGATGCNENPNQPPVGPDISGKWSGIYQDPGGPEIPVSATIAQNGSDLFVETSLPTYGRLMTGYMDADGHAFLEDAYEGGSGGSWSTVAGTVTPNYVDFIDYAYGPGTSLRHITLHR